MGFPDVRDPGSCQDRAGCPKGPAPVHGVTVMRLVSDVSPMPPPPVLSCRRGGQKRTMTHTTDSPCHGLMAGLLQLRMFGSTAQTMICSIYFIPALKLL